MTRDVLPPLPVPEEPAPPPRRAFETWVDEKKPAAWLAAAARAMRGWAIGREVTETEFDTALADAGSVRIGYALNRE
jgi:hypothetical protein